MIGEVETLEHPGLRFVRPKRLASVRHKVQLLIEELARAVSEYLDKLLLNFTVKAQVPQLDIVLITGHKSKKISHTLISIEEDISCQLHYST